MNYVDDTAITQASVVRFIEDNWLGGQRIGQGSNDAATGSIMSMFDFNRDQFTVAKPIFLDPIQGTKVPAPIDPRLQQTVQVAVRSNKAL